MARPTKLRNKWRIRWIDAQGKRRSEVYDNKEDAHFALKRHELEAEEVRRGLRPLRLPDKTIEDLCKYWLDKRAPSKRSYQDDVSIVNTHLLPFFRGRKIIAITPALANEYKLAKNHLDDKTVNNHLTLLIAMLHAARDELNWLTNVPKIKKHRVQVFSTDYRYLRTNEEIVRFLLTAKRFGEMTFMLYSTAIYTGMRAGELACLQWDDVSFDHRLITVQRSFNGPTKSGDVRYVPILDALLRPLQSWRLQHPGQLVFTNHYGNRLNPSQRIFQETLHAVLNTAGFPRVHFKGKDDQPYLTFHCLRHTFASHWMMKSGDLFKLQKILGHKDIKMTQRYAHLAPKAFAKDYDRFGQAIDQIGKITVLQKSS